MVNKDFGRRNPTSKINIVAIWVDETWESKENVEAFNETCQLDEMKHFCDESISWYMRCRGIPSQIEHLKYQVFAFMKYVGKKYLSGWVFHQVRTFAELAQFVQFCRVCTVRVIAELSQIAEFA